MIKALIFLLTVHSTLSFAVKSIIKEETFKNKNCLSTDSCDLKTFHLKVYKEQESSNSFAEKSNSYMEGYYQTANNTVLEKYAVVQFIKGCNYKTGLRDGEIAYQGFALREFFGEPNTLFKHKDWVIDSIDYDPIYASVYTENSRHGYYKTLFDESKSVIFDHRKHYEYYLFKPVPKKPRLYFSDMPMGGELTKVIIPKAGKDKGRRVRSYINTSLFFKTCIYKTKDVAINGGKNAVDSKDAIHCFDWQSTHILNKKTKKFESVKKVDPVCLKEL